MCITKKSYYSSRRNVTTLLSLMSWFTKIVFLFFFHKVSISIIFLFELIINHYMYRCVGLSSVHYIISCFSFKPQSTSNKFLFCFNNFLKISNNPSYHRIIIHMSDSVLNHLKSLKRTQTFHIFHRPHLITIWSLWKQNFFFFFHFLILFDIVIKVILFFFMWKRIGKTLFVCRNCVWLKVGWILWWS